MPASESCSSHFVSGKTEENPQADAAQSRQEPYWGVPPPSPAYSALHQADTLNHEEKLSKRRTFRMALGVATFVLGTVVGCGVAWWMFSSVSNGPRHVMAVEKSPTVSAIDNPQSERMTPLRGISPDELPYDGASRSHGGEMSNKLPLMGQTTPAMGANLVADDKSELT